MDKRKIEVFPEIGIAVVPLGGKKPGAPRACIIDADDAEMVGHYNWYPKIRSDGRAYYAATGVREVDGTTQIIYLHRMLCPAPDGLLTDHINRNTMDNRRSNLRVADTFLNTTNRSIPKDRKRVRRTASSSIYRGVRKRVNGNHTVPWVARIRVRGTEIFLGAFAIEEDAARAYDRAVREFHGPGFPVNFPDD